MEAVKQEWSQQRLCLDFAKGPVFLRESSRQGSLGMQRGFAVSARYTEQRERYIFCFLKGLPSS